MVFQGLPQNIEAEFWSADRTTIIGMQNAQKGILYKRFWMILHEDTLERYSIDKRDIRSGGQLDYSISGNGVFVREYPAEYCILKLDNPQNPIMKILCNFDGTLTIESEIQAMAYKLIRFEKISAELQKENSNLIKKIGELSEEIAEIKSRFGVR